MPLDRATVTRSMAMISMICAGACSAQEGSGQPAPALEPSPTPDSTECGPPPGKWEEGVDPPAYCVREVKGRLTDSAGRALGGMTVSVCGVACFGARTDANGAFVARPKARLPDGAYVFFAHARPRHGSVLVPMPAAPPENVDLGVLEVPMLDASGAMLPADGGPASTVTTSGLTFTIPEGTSWELAFEDLTDDIEGRVVRSARVSVDRAPAFAKGALTAYALAPFDARASKKVGVTIAENAGLPPGAEVELIVMAPLGLGSPNTGGSAEVAARGHVSADGRTIATDPGEGITTFTWLAVRPKR